METQIRHYENKLNFEMDAADLFGALAQHKEIIVIDARKDHAYAIEHIPGAVNIPHRTMDEVRTAHLKKDALYVTYCDGIGCNASTRGALNMARLGFTVKELIGGIAWWKLDGYATAGTQAVAGKEINCAC